MDFKSILAILLALWALCAFIPLGIALFRRRKEGLGMTDLRRTFPYEVFGSSRMLPDAILSFFFALSYVGYVIPVAILFSALGILNEPFLFSYLSGAIFVLVLAGALNGALLYIPASHVKLHTGIFFGASLLLTLSSAMEGIILLSIREGSYSLELGPWVILLATILFVISLLSLILVFNPKLRQWYLLKATTEKDGSVHYERPKVFILALTEWLLSLLGALAMLLTCLAIFLL